MSLSGILGTWKRNSTDWLRSMSASAAFCCFNCLCLSSEFRRWWHDLSWLPRWLRCYVTSRFPILLKVVRRKHSRGACRKIMVKGQNKKPETNSYRHCRPYLWIYFSFYGMYSIFTSIHNFKSFAAEMQ